MNKKIIFKLKHNIVRSVRPDISGNYGKTLSVVIRTFCVLCNSNCITITHRYCWLTLTTHSTVLTRSIRFRTTHRVTGCSVTYFRFGHVSGTQSTTITSGSKVSSITYWKNNRKATAQVSCPYRVDWLDWRERRLRADTLTCVKPESSYFCAVHN